jgi:hypothetical protein
MLLFYIRVTTVLNTSHFHLSYNLLQHVSTLLGHHQVYILFLKLLGCHLTSNSLKSWTFHIVADSDTVHHFVRCGCFIVAAVCVYQLTAELFCSLCVQMNVMIRYRKDDLRLWSRPCTRTNILVQQNDQVQHVFLFSFLWWGDTEVTWYVGHFFTYCTSPGW